MKAVLGLITGSTGLAVLSIGAAFRLLEVRSVASGLLIVVTATIMTVFGLAAAFRRL